MTRIFGSVKKAERAKGNRFTHTWDTLDVLDCAEWKEFKCPRCGLVIEYPKDPNNEIWFSLILDGNTYYYQEHDVPSCAALLMDRALD